MKRKHYIDPATRETCLKNRLLQHHVLNMEEGGHEVCISDIRWSMIDIKTELLRLRVFIFFDNIRPIFISTMTNLLRFNWWSLYNLIQSSSVILLYKNYTQLYFTLIILFISLKVPGQRDTPIGHPHFLVLKALAQLHLENQLCLQHKEKHRAKIRIKL